MLLVYCSYFSFIQHRTFFKLYFRICLIFSAYCFLAVCIFCSFFFLMVCPYYWSLVIKFVQLLDFPPSIYNSSGSFVRYSIFLKFMFGPHFWFMESHSHFTSEPTLSQWINVKPFAMSLASVNSDKHNVNNFNNCGILSPLSKKQFTKGVSGIADNEYDVKN